MQSRTIPFSSTTSDTLAITMSTSNIWTAASEGSLDRVRYWIETEHLSPSVRDDNSYTPIHAAASWGHEDILRYLITERAGDVNTVDDDGETALFVVEEERMAKVLVELGVDTTRKNEEGLRVNIDMESYSCLSH